MQFIYQYFTKDGGLSRDSGLLSTKPVNCLNDTECSSTNLRLTPTMICDTRRFQGCSLWNCPSWALPPFVFRHLHVCKSGLRVAVWKLGLLYLLASMQMERIRVVLSYRLTLAANSLVELRHNNRFQLRKESTYLNLGTSSKARETMFSFCGLQLAFKHPKLKASSFLYSSTSPLHRTHPSIT